MNQNQPKVDTYLHLFISDESLNYTCCVILHSVLLTIDKITGLLLDHKSVGSHRSQVSADKCPVSVSVVDGSRCEDLCVCVSEGPACSSGQMKTSS